MDANIDPSIEKWFKMYRESYEWPPCTGRKESEQIISKLQSSASSAINENQAGKLKTSLTDIYQWKTKNRRTLDYRKTLDSLGEDYLHKIISLGPFNNTEKLESLINTLHVEYCNLPACSAIASFLFNRQDVPIFDRFLVLFFARKFKDNLVDEETTQVLRFVKRISFKIGPDGCGKLRPDIYGKNNPGFKVNFDKYIDEFVPECKRIAEYFHQSNTTYLDIQKKMVEFYPIDVEMAIFSYATKHNNLF